MSFADTPYAGAQRFLAGQAIVIPLKVRQALRGPALPREHDDPLFDPNEGVTYTVFYGVARTYTAIVDAPMTRVSQGLYQATYVSDPADLPGQYLVEAVATHGPKTQRTWYRAAFWIAEE